MLYAKNGMCRCSSFSLEQLEGRRLASATSWFSSGSQTITDLATLRSSINVNGLSGAIRDVNVRLDISHTWDADLDVFLISPQGRRIELFTDVGGSGDGFSATMLDDEASASVAFGAAPFSGAFRPEGSLSAMDGLNANGTWLLEITDDAGLDIGRLNSWSITLDTADVTNPAAGDNSPGAARNLGALGSQRTFNDYVGRSDTNDYYRFTVNRTSRFSLAMSGLSADADVQLLNANQTVIASSVRGGSSSESISRTISAGTYYVRVYPYGGANTNYTLRLTAGGSSGGAPGDGVVTRRALLVSAGFDNDCYGIRSALLRSGGNAWRTSNITVITDATAAELASGIQALANASDADDLAMVYITCHGAQLSYDAGTQDESDGQDGIVAMTDGAVTDDTLGAWCSVFASRPIGQFLLVTDACNSEEMFDGAADAGRVVPNSISMSACRATELAQAGNPYSVFTNYLVGALQAGSGADRNNNGWISAEEMFTYADGRTNQHGHDPAILDRYAGEMNLFRA
jgi:subtilisin-like proprotein convertase family protein